MWVPAREIGLAVPEAEVAIDADELRLEQVLVNLLENARKYSPPGTPITVRVWTTADAAAVAVQDEGAGIPLEEQARIFERFHRASNIDRSSSGFGLGLHIAREIVEQHGGQIEVRSPNGGGTAFVVTLPDRLEGGGGQDGHRQAPGQNTARGFTGDPVPPRTESGATASRNS